MKQVLSFFTRVLHNSEHNQFHFEVKKIFALKPVIKTALGPLFDSYEAAIEVEATALQAELGSAETKTITELDGYRDMLEHGYALNVESKSYHFDPAVRASAERVQRILSQYGDARKLPYNEESSVLSNRNTALKTNYAADLTIMDDTLWVDKLEDANNNFIAHFGDRANEEAARISGNVRDTRIVVDPIYEDIITRVNALAVVNGEADYAELIDQINYYINYYKTTVAARKGHKKPVEKAV